MKFKNSLDRRLKKMDNYHKFNVFVSDLGTLRRFNFLDSKTYHFYKKKAFAIKDKNKFEHEQLEFGNIRLEVH